MVLYLSDEMDLDLKLPELYGLLGEALTMAFLEIFGGRKIVVPPVAQVRKAYKTVAAYMKYDELISMKGEEDVAERVAVELDMSPGEVTAAWASVRKMLARLEEGVRGGSQQI